MEAELFLDEKPDETGNMSQHRISGIKFPVSISTNSEAAARRVPRALLGRVAWRAGRGRNLIS